jgi:DNA-binding SARP family transcriptional activator/tetratricopeptide (TPR) repeat protein
MRFQLLGPVEVWAGTERVPAGPPRQVAVLAALLVDAERVVPVEVLVDRVWGADAPDHARRTIQSYVARLRGILGDVLVPEAGGYVLRAGEVDVHRFTALVARAGGRVEVLGEALELWRGEPLGGIDGEWAEQTRERWRRQYLDAVLDWAPLALAAGVPVIDRLTAVVDRYPLVEPAAAWLIRALHAAGRTADALERYTRTARLLAGELGAEPGPELREAQREVLSGTVAPEPPTRVRPPAGPAMLPADVPGFVGRTEVLRRLDDLLDVCGAVAALSGTAGVGKTSLAVHWAHAVAERFPDGQLYANLRGFDPAAAPLDPDAVLRQFLTVLGVERPPTGSDALTAAYRGRLEGRRMLVLLDNAADAAQVRPLLPAAPGCVTVVTSRNQLAGLTAAGGPAPMVVDPMDAAEAWALLAERLGADRLAAEPDAVRELVERCGRLPLALVVVAARAALRPYPRLAVLAAELREDADRLAALSSPDDPHTDLRAVLGCSERALSPAAGRLFRLLGQHCGPDFSAPAARSLAGGDIRRPLAELVRASLLAEPRHGRYVMHDLVRAYAAEHPADGAALERLLDHYVHSASAATERLGHAPELREILDRPTLPGVTPERPADRDAALAWFDAEHRVLITATTLAGFDRYVCELTMSLNGYMSFRGRRPELVVAAGHALAAARRLGDRVLQGRAYRLLAVGYNGVGRLDEAVEMIRHAIDVEAGTGDLRGRAANHLTLANLLSAQGEHREAAAECLRARDLQVTLGDPVWAAASLSSHGWYLILAGDYEPALAACREVLPVFRELNNLLGECATLDTLGYAAHHLGRYAEAVDHYKQSLALAVTLGDDSGHAVVLDHLGDTYAAMGAAGPAAEAWREAATELEQLGRRDAERIRAKLAAARG